jgi:hypothetical protein
MGKKITPKRLAFLVLFSSALLMADPIQNRELRFKNFVEQNHEDDPNFMKNFIWSSFCFDGIDSNLAATKFYKLLRANPKRVLSKLDETLDAINSDQNADETICMNHIPDLNFRTDAYAEFSSLIKDSFDLQPMKNKSLAAAAQDEYLAWREEFSKRPSSGNQMNQVVSVIDKLQSKIFQ